MKIKKFDQTLTKKELVDAIVAKNYRYLKDRSHWVEELVNGISPFYRELIFRIISCNSIKLRLHYAEIDSRCESEGTYREKLYSKRADIEVHSSFDPDTFCHELGHAVDSFYGSEQRLTETMEIEPGRTFFKFYTEEFLDHKKEIYDYVIGWYWNLSEQRIGKRPTDIIRRYLPLYQLLFRPKNKGVSQEEFASARRSVHKALDRVDFVDAYCRLYEARVSESTQAYFGPITDSLTSLYDGIGELGLRGHYQDYYQYAPRTVSEFFANLFATELLSDRKVEEYLLRFFPRSMEAFQKLFGQVYNHFVSGEKFTLPGKKFTYQDDNAMHKLWHEGRQSALAYIASLGDEGRPMDEESKKLYAQLQPIFAPKEGPKYDWCLNILPADNEDSEDCDGEGTPCMEEDEAIYEEEADENAWA